MSDNHQTSRPATLSQGVQPSPARIYDYLLGGTRHYAVDRAAAEQIRAALPEAADAARANRAFHHRAAIWMAHQGITQFVDAGCGLPTQSPTHWLLQQVNPAARVVYADHDPAVIAHAQELLTRDGRTAVVLADLRDPASLLAALHLDAVVDLAQPVGLLCTAVLHFVSDADDPHACVQRLVAALAPGSYMALSHATADQMPPAAIAAAIAAYSNATERLYPRGKADVARFFTGLTLVPPYEEAPAELCRIGVWGAEDPAEAADDSSQPCWAGVGQKT
jgi:trans-aconitate methyltransferase